MALRAFNTLSRRKEDLAPDHGGEMRIYVCGVTVWDASHIGHGRSAIVFDVIRRYIRHRGYAVKFVRNFTDIDDKIIRRANQEGVSAQEISERYIAEYRADLASLGVLPADVEPKATEHIPQMITLIERLIRQGVAYPVEGDVYFEVRRFPGYGKPSGKNLEELQAAPASRWTIANATRSTSRSGRRPSRASQPGRARGATAARAGTSSARRWRCSTWAKRSTCTAGART